MYLSELTMYDYASITGNSRGVVEARKINMFGYSSVSNNIADDHAGIIVRAWNSGSTGQLIIHDQSSVHGNMASPSGGRGGGVSLMNNTELIMKGGIIYGSIESGAPPEKANSASGMGASIASATNNKLIYGDGSEILLEYYGDSFHDVQYFRNDTLTGKE